MTRRGFIRRAMQGAAAVALAAVVGVLARRTLTAGADADAAPGSCDNRFICRGCRRLDSCGLPQALSARQSVMANPNSGRAI
jgi:hypothetical protein